jgi:enterochelin esterase family protein
MTRAIVPVALVVLGTVTAASGQARTVRIQSGSLGTRTVAVLLPTGYDESDTRYPVLYLLHGGGQDHSAFMARPGFGPRARRVQMIVVMPAGDRGGLSAAAVTGYEDFLARELVPYIDANYRTIASPDRRAIAGLSMGGMFAAGTASRHPALFGIAGGFSAAFRPESPAPPAPDGAPYFYLSCGTLDSLLRANRQWVESLKAANVAHEYHEIPGFGHAWDFWDPQIDTFIQFLSTARGWPLSTSQAGR